MTKKPHNPSPFNAAKSRALEATLTAIRAVEDATAILPKGATVHCLDALSVIGADIDDARERLRNLKLDSVDACPLAADEVGDVDPYYFLMRNIAQAFCKTEATAGHWWGKSDDDDEDVEEMLEKLNSMLREAETLLMKISVRYVQTKAHGRKAAGGS